MKIIGIAGGSGSGKSTVSEAFVRSDPETFETICIDDYHKLRTDPDLPMMEGMINWDHPDIIRWDNLLSDIRKLKNGQAVTIEVKSPDYVKTRVRIPHIIKPKPVLIIEGYLTLYNPELRKLFDKSFYLELDPETRSTRRDKDGLIGLDDYPEKILKPMHEKYVEPSKQNADEIIDVSDMSVEELTELLIKRIDKIN